MVLNREMAQSCFHFRRIALPTEKVKSKGQNGSEEASEEIVVFPKPEKKEVQNRATDSNGHVAFCFIFYAS